MKRFALLVPLLVAPVFANASINVDKALMCDMPALTFFEPLVQRKMIDIRPYHVEGSLSYFRPLDQLFGKNSGGMFAFGMKVDSVFGFVSGQLLFVRGPVEPPNTYGVVVQESIANVQAQLNSMGATRARTLRISSSRTAITCEGT